MLYAEIQHPCEHQLTWTSAGHQGLWQVPGCQRRSCWPAAHEGKSKQALDKPEQA